MNFILKIYHDGKFFAENYYSSNFYTKEQIIKFGEELVGPYSNRSFRVE